MHRDRAEDSEAVFAALKTGYFVRLTGIAIEEMFATSDSPERAAILACAGRLRHGPTDTLLPHNDLLQLLIAAHKTAPDSFDWRSVNITTSEYGRVFSDRDVIADDAFSAHAREDLKQQRKKFETPFSNLRLKLEEIFKRHGSFGPTSFREVLPSTQGEGGLVWGFAKDLYDTGAGTDVSETAVRQFMNSCPPFRAFVYALLLVWYDRSLRERHMAEKFRAGRLDLYMAVYLPYCDQFITAEDGGEQERCLREVANAADLKTEVRSYDDFCSGMLVHV